MSNRIIQFRYTCNYRPHPKDGEGNVFTLSTLGGGGQVSPARGWAGGEGSGQSSQGGSGQSSWGGVSPARGGVRSVQPGGGQSSQWGGSGQSSRGGGSVQPVGGIRSLQPGAGGSGHSSWGGVSPAGGGGEVSQWGEGSASCALLWAVCLLRSRRRTFL